MIVIGLGHKARHGKDTVAKEMVKYAGELGLFARVYAFGDALKSFARVMGMREKNPRLLQALGTEVFRSIDEDIWVRVLLDTIREQDPDIAIISDMRFPNEMAAIQKLRGTTVKVSRLTETSQPWVPTDRDPNHPSETALDDANFEWYISAQSGNTVALQSQARTVLGSTIRSAER